MTYNVFGGTLSLTQSINQIAGKKVIDRELRPSWFSVVVFIHNMKRAGDRKYLEVYICQNC